MDKNTIFAFLLIGLVLLLWPLYQKKILGVNPQQQQTEQVASQELPDTSPVTDSSSSSVEDEPVMKVAPKRTLAPVTYDAPPETLFIENDKFKAAFSTVGGGTILNWQLKEYPKVVKDKLTGKDVKKPVDLIPSQPQDGNLGLQLVFPDGETFDMSRRVFKVAEADSHSIRFTSMVEGIGTVEKTISTDPDRYALDVSVTYLDSWNQPGYADIRFGWATGLASTEKQVKDEDTYHQAYALQGGELLKEKKGSTGIKEGSTDWVALRNKYFVMAMIPKGGSGKAALLEKKPEPVQVVDYYGNTIKWKDFNCQLYQATKEGHAEMELFLGPLDLDLLKSKEVKLEKTMDFGWAIIRVFSVPLYYALGFLGRLLGNYGLAIIVLSILIKVVLYPLTRKSYQSMREMQALQPKITALRDKYSKDPQKLNAETMKLYKEHGVNPAGGCLPMLLQMPVLFALFRLFRSTIMFRLATFGPISDLASPDALIQFGTTAIHVLPILMGVTMFIQQKISVQDPKQKMMAYFMPIFLTFIFYRMSAGLNLYYLMFNVLTIAQEKLIKKPKTEAEA